MLASIEQAYLQHSTYQIVCNINLTTHFVNAYACCRAITRCAQRYKASDGSCRDDGCLCTGPGPSVPTAHHAGDNGDGAAVPTGTDYLPLPHGAAEVSCYKGDLTAQVDLVQLVHTDMPDQCKHGADLARDLVQVTKQRLYCVRHVVGTLILRDSHEGLC
jgi:hypothetical protein